MKPKYSLVRVRASRRLLIPTILATALAFALGGKSVHAQTWNQTAAGTTYQWGTATNWTPNTVPNTTTAVANINNNIAGAQTINLASGTAANRTVNDLNLGDSDSTHGFTIAPGVTGSLLIFGGTAPTMDITGNIGNTISAGIQADANLIFRSTSTGETTISAAMTAAAARNVTFNNDINGTVTAAAINQGQFSLTAANTLYSTTGTTAISDVRVRGTVAGAFGANAANTVTVSGAGQMYVPSGTHVNNVILNSTGWTETGFAFGALRVETGAILNGTVTLQQNSTIGSNSGTGTIGGVVSGAFNLTKVGAGTLALGAANTYTGTTTITQGTISLAGSAVLGGATGSTADANNIVFGSNLDSGILQFETVANLGPADQIRFRNTGGTAGAGGALVYAGTTSQTLSKTIQCDTSIGIRLESNSVGGSLTFSGAFSQTDRTLYLGGTGTGVNRMSTIFGGTGALVKRGAGMWQLTAANTFSGATTISAGILRITNNTALGTAAGGVTQSGSSALEIDGTAAAVTVGAEALSINGGGISNGGALRNIAGNNTYGGTVTMAAQSRINSDAGTLTLNNATASVTGAFNLIVGGAGNVTISTPMTNGTGGVGKDGTGNLTLSGANTFTGTTTINAGTLTLGAAAPSGAAGTLGNATSAVLLGNTSGAENASLLTSGAFTIARPVTVQAGNTGSITIGGSGANASIYSGAVTLNKAANVTAIASGTSTFSGIVSGAGTLTKTGAGTVVLSNANTFTGAVTVDAGTLRISNATALGTNAAVGLTAAGTTLDIQGTITTGSGKTVTLNTNTTGDLRSTLLNGANNNTWAGNVVAAGTGFAQISAASGTTLTISGNITSSGAAGTGTMAVRGVGNVILNGNINLGTERAFTHTDSGTVIVNSTGNVYTRAQVSDGQIQIGINNALDTAKEFTFGQSSSSSGRLELNGFSQTVTRLNTAASSTGTNHILRNSNLTTASTLTFATPTSTTDTLTNVQVQGSFTPLQGALHMVSNGLGRTEFNQGALGANSWTVNSGTVAFTGTTSRVLPGSVTGLASATIEKAGASTLTATSTWNNAGTTNVVGGTLVLGSGTAGAVNVSDGATLTTGLAGGVLTSSAVTFGTAGATNYVPLLTSAGAAAPLNATALTANGAVTVTPQAASFTTGTYRLLDYTGSIGGSGSFTLGAVGTIPHMSSTLDTTTPGQVNLVITAVDSLIWAGQTSGVWDVNTTSNFALASSPSTGATFYSGDAVVFGDTHDVGGAGTPVTNRTITGSAITIGNLTFSNSAGDYSVANVLTGVGAISKSGTSAVTLSGANTLQGGAVTVTGGTLRIGNSDALRGAGSITVSGGGTFDANGTAVGTRYPELVVSGAGVGGNGAIVNNGADILNNSHFTQITLAGNTTWGGSGRYDLVQSQTLNGGSFTLTKSGAGALYYDPAASSTLENVIVNGGIFGMQGSNRLSATATVTVDNGGTHQFWSGVTAQHKVVLNDGGIFNQGSSAGTLTGQVTLNGTTTGRNIQAVTGGTLNIAGKITGTGGFTVNGAGTVQLQNATNDYAGDTQISAGTLNFSAAGILPATTNLIINGGTFATGNIARSVASLSGTGGTISGGNVLTSNQSTTTVWNGILSGSTAQMSGSGSLTLGGTADNNSGIAIVNSGTLIFAKGNTAAVAQAIHSVGGGVGVTVNGGTLQLGGSYDNITTPGTGANLAPVGINTTTYVDHIFNQVGVVLNAGTFDLNGRQEAINGLTNPAGSGGTVTNTSATASKLYVGYNNATSIFGGAINDGTGTVAIEKIGTGALTLTGASNFSGGLTATAGTVVLDGTITGTGAIAVNGTSLFAGSGTSGGTLTAATGTTVRVGTASGGTAATTLTLGGLNVSGGANINLDFNSAGTTVDKVATTVSNGLSISGVNNLNVVLSGAGWVPGTYPVLTYVGAVQGTGANNTTLALSTPKGHSTVDVVDDTLGNVNLVVSGAANKWVGGAAGNINLWDTDNTLNWNAGDQKFLTGDTVVFDDTATTFAPNILANQTAAGVTFDNTTPYTLTSTGTFGIAGTGGLIKKNTGTVTISSANTYTGTTEVQEGTLIANFNTGTAKTVFAAASVINVASSATFKAVTNDSNFTLANALIGTGLVVIDPHLTASAAVRDVTISGSNAGFTGTLRLSPTVVGDGSGTFRSNQLSSANASGATIDVDAGGQAWLTAATFPNNFILTGHGYAEAAGATPVVASGLTQYSGAVKGGIGAIRMNNGTIISGNVTLDGSAKIMAYDATGTISGSISLTNPTDLLVVGGGGLGSNLILTGTNNVGANALNGVFVNAGGSTGTNVLQIGNLGTTGTLGTGVVTLYTDAAAAQLRIQRSDGYTMAQNVTALDNGTATNLTKASFVANTQGAGLSLNGYTIDLTDGTNTAARAGGVFVAGAGGAAGVNNAIFNIDGSSTIKTGNFFIADQAGFSGTVNQSGTSSVEVANHVRVSHYGTNTSTYNFSAGTLTVANINTVTDPSGTGEQSGGIYLGVDGTGIMNQSGGTVTTDWIVLDNRGDTAAGTNMPDGIDRYNLSNGTLILRSQWGITQRNTSTAVALSGGTIRNGGTDLQVRLDIAPDVSAAVTLDNVSAGNSFNLTRNATGAGSLALLGGGTLKFTTATTQNIAVPVTGSASVEKLGVGITTLSSANTYDGTTTISAGTLQVGVASAIPSGASKGNVVFGAAGTSSVLDLNGKDTSINGLSQNSISTANLVVNNATGTDKTLTLGNNNATATFGGIIANNTSGTGTLALTKVGTGTQNLTGTNTFTGAITVNGGMLGFTSSPATNGPLGNSTAINLNGGGLSYIAAVSNHPLNRSVAIGAGDGTLDVTSVAGGLTLVGANVTSTGGNLIKTGLGAVSISGTTTLNGGAAGVEVNNGTLQAGFGASGVSTIDVGATGTLSMQNAAIETLTLGNTAGALTLAGGARLGFEFDGATNDRVNVGATGTASLTPGVITLDLFNFGTGITAGNTYTLLSAPAGDLTGGGLTSYVIGAAPSGFNYSLNVTATSVTLTVVAFSPAYWTNSQSTGSWSTLDAGPLSNFSTLATAGVNTAALPGANETVFFSENGVTGPTVTSTLDGNFTINSLNFVAGAGTVTAANINQGTSGTLTLQPFTGLGGIDVGANAGVATIGAPVVASSTNSPTQTWNVDGTGVNGSSLTLNGAVTFNAGVIKSGAGTLTLGNAGNTGAGNFTLSSGTLALTATGNMPTGVLTIGSGTTINNTGAGAITLAHSGYTWNGNFTQSGQSLNLGSGAVSLGASVVATIPANTLTVGGGIDDGALTFGLTKADAGALVLNGDNGYDGVTTMNAGVLTLAGNNSGASGGVTLAAGLLNINSDNALGTGRLTFSGGTFDNTSAGSVTQAGNPTQTWSNAVNMTFTGTQALNLGSGDVTLGTDATAGSFTLTNNSALSGTSLTVGGEISAVIGGTAGVKTLTIAGAGSTALTGSITRGSASALDITVTSGGTTTLSGPASSIRTINLNGGASSILDLGAGNLTITNGGANGFVSSLGGTINASGGGKIVLGSDVLDNGTANGTTLTVNAQITGPFTFEIYGGSATSTGVTVLTAQNTYTGRTDINGGNLSVSNIGNTGSTTSNLGSGTTIQSGAAVLSGSTVTTGKLIYTGAGETTNRILSLNGAGFAIEQAGASGNLLFSANVSVPSTVAKTLFLLGSTAGTGEISGVIPNNTAATSINKLGSGTWTLSGASTYTGNTTVSEGTLVLSGRGTGNPGVFTVSSLAGLSATMNITAGTYNLGGNRMNIGNAATTAATGTLNQSGGAVTFTSGDQLVVGLGTVGNTGVYNLSGGSLTTAAATTRGVILGVNSNPTPGPSSGGGIFNLSGTGALNMTAASGGGGNAALLIGRSDTAGNNTTNAFNQTGGTANVGILAMGGAAAGSTGVSATLNLTGGTFSANSFTLMSAGGTNTSIINIGGTAAVTLPNFPTNAKGAGSSATITFDSTTGFLSPLAASATYMPAGTFNNAYLTANGAKFNVGTGNDITVAQVLQDAVSPAAAGTLTKSGAGVLTLTAANTYTGNTVLNAGVLNVGVAETPGTSGPLGNQLATATGTILFNGGTLQYSAANTFDYSGRFSSAASQNYRVDTNAQNVTWASELTSSNGILTKSGAGTLTLSGDNSYSGGTSISAGTLQIGANGATGTLGSGAVANAGTLVFNRTNSYTLDSGNLVTGAGAVVFANTGSVATAVDGQFNTTGALTFGATNGSVTVAALDLTNGSSTFGGAFTVQTNSASVNTITIGSGKTLATNGNVTIGSNAAGQTTNLTVAGATAGAGSWTVTNAAASGSFQVGGATGGANSSAVIADLSSLGTFNANLSGATSVFRIGDISSFSTGSVTQTLRLAANSSITAATVGIGDSSGGGGGAGNAKVLSLGTGVNMINANTINIGETAAGGSRGSGRVDFQHVSDGSLIIRSQNGSLSTANLTMVNNGNNGTTQHDAKLLLAGHTADVSLNNLVMATRTLSGVTGGADALITFDTGTFTANTVAMAARTGTIPSTTNTTGTITINGGTVSLGAVTMAVNTSTSATASPGLAIATLNISNGAVTASSINMANAGNTGVAKTATAAINLTAGSLTLAGDITRTGGAGTENATITLNGSTLNMAGNDIGTDLAAISVVAQSGTLSNVASINGTGGLTKSTAGILTLTGTNGYTGSTSVTEGTLALVGGSQASPITVSAGASLGFTLGSPTTSTSTFNLTNGTIKITGTPTLPSYTLITDSAGITGTPTLDAPIPGYSLVKQGNSLVLTTPQALYDTWKNGTFANAFTLNSLGQDQDGDTFLNLMEYAFGTDPTVNSSAPLSYTGGVLNSTGQPILVKDAGVWYAVFGRRKDHVEAGLTYTVEFSNSLSTWVDSVTIPTVIATDGTIDAVRVPFPNFIDGPSGPQKPTFFRVEVQSSF